MAQNKKKSTCTKSTWFDISRNEERCQKIDIFLTWSLGVNGLLLYRFLLFFTLTVATVIPRINYLNIQLTIKITSNILMQTARPLFSGNKQFK